MSRRVWVILEPDTGQVNTWTVAPTRADCIAGFNRDQSPDFYAACRRKGWALAVPATLTLEKPKSKRSKR